MKTRSGYFAITPIVGMQLYTVCVHSTTSDESVSYFSESKDKTLSGAHGLITTVLTESRKKFAHIKDIYAVEDEQRLWLRQMHAECVWGLKQQQLIPDDVPQPCACCGDLVSQHAEK